MLLITGPALAQDTFVTFDTGQVRPVAVSPDGSQLFAVNTPDNTLEIFDIDGSGDLTRAGSVQVGMEPVAVAARTNTEVWVVNFLSDSVSIVDLSGSTPRVVRTLHVGDEPSDIVFAGSSGDRAFITTAHRGQNTPNPDGDYDVEGIGRADIWVFHATQLGTDMGGAEETIITVFGDKPRALAVNDDGSRVYAAILHSGNQTMALNPGYICETSQSNLDNDIVQGSCSLAGGTSPGGTPPPHNNTQGLNRPGTGLIVKFNRDGGTSGEWQDELGRNWNDFVKFSLPDRDVFEINANADPPAAIDGNSTCADGSGCWAGVGTILFNMIVHPTSDKIYVSNTDSQNHVRFEGPGSLANGIKPNGEPTTVQGDLARARITVLDGTNVNHRHLNKHIDYDTLPAPPGIKDDSLATPLGMEWNAAATKLYVAAFGSGKVGVFDVAQLDADTFTPSSTNHIQLSGGGASGLVRQGNRLYVLTRFDNSISIVDVNSEAEVGTVALHNPEPPSVVAGRPFLYDANLTSSNGEASCSSCHIFGDMDDLAWDLGNPDDIRVPIPANQLNDQVFSDFQAGLSSCLIQQVFAPGGCNFHPMKGPMTTQSLRGLDLQGPQHWRGDRQGDANSAFNAFNGAFPGLVGRDAELTTQQMQAYTDFALQIRYPPNPIRNLDRSFTTQQQQGSDKFFNDTTDTVATCNGCHVVDATLGFFGGEGLATFDAETQIFKVPHLRNMYQKVGMFGNAEPEPISNPIPQIGTGPAFDGPYTHTGDQVRGYGYTHDGTVDTLFRFVSAGVFSLNNTEQSRVEAFMIALDSDLAPIVGQQVTLTSTSVGAVGTRVTLMYDRARTSFRSKVLEDMNGGLVNECELIAKLSDGGTPKGYLYDPGSDRFQPDDGGPVLTDAVLRTKAGTPGNEITYTCVPPGSGHRMGVDRDEDTLLDGAETGTGIFVSASDTGTRADMADTDGDGFDDPTEVAAGTDPNDRFDYPGAVALPVLSAWGATLLVAALMVASLWHGRRRAGQRA
jgi:hypothetical protein